MFLFSCVLKMPATAFRTKNILKLRSIITLELLIVQRFRALLNVIGSSDLFLVYEK